MDKKTVKKNYFILHLLLILFLISFLVLKGRDNFWFKQNYPKICLQKKYQG